MFKFHCCEKVLYSKHITLIQHFFFFFLIGNLIYLIIMNGHFYCSVFTKRISLISSAVNVTGTIIRVYCKITFQASIWLN